MWIKKENIYHKPFYKQKLKMTMLVVFVIGLIFLAYQIFYMNQLVMSTVPHIVSTLPIVSSSLKPKGIEIEVFEIFRDNNEGVR